MCKQCGGKLSMTMSLPFAYFRQSILNCDQWVSKRKKEEFSAISYFYFMDCSEEDIIRWIWVLLVKLWTILYTLTKIIYGYGVAYHMWQPFPIGNRFVTTSPLAMFFTSTATYLYHIFSAKIWKEEKILWNILFNLRCSSKYKSKC